MTSGSYERFRESDGRRFSHVFDPKTGMPAATTLLSATVVSSDSTAADALATAFLAMGEERAAELLSSLPGTEAIFVHEKDGGIEIHATSGLKKLLTADGLTVSFR